jgi:hypothetical protein
MKKLKLLFLLKSNYNYGSPANVKAGLFNSVRFLTESLYDDDNSLVIKTAICQDGNSIDKEVHDFRPDICILDAIWVTPTKLAEIQNLHKSVVFIIRIHSKIPFLATEGMSLKWCKEFIKIPNVLISNNSEDSNLDFNLAGIPSSYLPNIYRTIPIWKGFSNYRLCKEDKKHNKYELYKDIHIGCFGAIRPLKNQLLQAFAAIHFANKHNLTLYFHVNAGRIEQRGEEPLKNMIALFEGTKHTLVQEGWFTHDEFIKKIQSMDLGMQCSYTESYNIVSADFVYCDVPIIVSEDIYWMPDYMKVDPNSSREMVRKLEVAFRSRRLVARESAQALNEQKKDGLKTWKSFLNYFR